MAGYLWRQRKALHLELAFVVGAPVLSEDDRAGV